MHDNVRVCAYNSGIARDRGIRGYNYLAVLSEKDWRCLKIIVAGKIVGCSDGSDRARQIRTETATFDVIGCAPRILETFVNGLA